jgi:hypothetical protein
VSAGEPGEDGTTPLSRSSPSPSSSLPPSSSPAGLCRVPVVPAWPGKRHGAPELAAARLVALLPRHWHCTSTHPDGGLVLEITPPHGTLPAAVLAAVGRALADPALRSWKLGD